MAASRISIVAAIARGGVIGHQGELPWDIPEDLVHFRTVTLGGTLIMGRRTFESIGRELPDRRTIVLTSASIPGVDTARSLAEAIAMTDDPAFVVGGEAVFAEAIPIADELILTHVDLDVEGDIRFPRYDESEWAPISLQEFDLGKFVTYRRVTDIFPGDEPAGPTADELGFDPAHICAAVDKLHEGLNCPGGGGKSNCLGDQEGIQPFGLEG